MVKDILTGSDGDMLVEGGDWVVGTSDEQHIEAILISDFGNWRQYPLLGVGVANFLLMPIDSESVNELKRKIRLQLEYDGYQVRELIIDGQLNINVDAKRI